MNIAFLGTRGIPAKYGGLETFVEEISTHLSKKGFTIFVVCQSDRFYEDEYRNIRRVHFHRLFKSNLTIPVIGDFIGTLYLIIRHNKDIDVYFFTNIGGSIPSIFLRLLGKKIIISSDGVEWRRMNRRITFVPWYQKPIYYITGNLLFMLEALSCKISMITIADSQAIKTYLEKMHRAKNVIYIAYGARQLDTSNSNLKDKEILKRFGLISNGYYLTVSRIVAENNIDMEIEGFKKSHSTKELVLIGNFHKKDHYSKYLEQIKKDKTNIKLLDPIYEQDALKILRKHCYAYIHSYEVGGTNPSLLEQMIFSKPILVYDIPFNKEVVRKGGIYFSDAESLSDKIDQLESKRINTKEKIEILQQQINKKYNWEMVSNEYEKIFKSLMR